MSDARSQWLEQRRTGVGGSDVAAILGLSKWRTPLDVYLDKRGQGAPQPDNEAMRWGRYLEPVVRQAYADETGRELLVLPYIVRHPVHAHMLATLDGFTSDGRIFEAKTTRTGEGWGEPGSDDIPQPYLLQIQHYMEVTGFAVADVAVLIGGSDFRIYEVPADCELQQMLVQAEAEFWACVQRAEPPEPVSLADMQARWGRQSMQGAVQASEAALQAVQTLHCIKAQKQAIDEAEEAAKTIVMRALAEHDTLVGPDGRALATWKASAPPQRFDAISFKASHPALHAEFVRAGEPSRRFLLKESEPMSYHQRRSAP